MSTIKIGIGETVEIQCAIKTLQQKGFTEMGARLYLLELGAGTLSACINFNEVLRSVQC